MAGDLRVPVIVRTQIAAGVSFTDSNLVVFGANDFSDDADVAARPEPKRSKTAAFVSDFRDLASAITWCMWSTELRSTRV